MNIQKLKKVIQEANPEIMELKFGCEFKYQDRLHRIVQKIKGNMYLGGDGKIWSYEMLTQAKYLEILGRPIRLADVLLALEEQVKINMRDSKREVELLSNNMEYLWAETKNIIKYWNLKKDFDNQSDKCKELLVKILLKRKLKNWEKEGLH